MEYSNLWVIGNGSLCLKMVQIWPFIAYLNVGHRGALLNVVADVTNMVQSCSVGKGVGGILVYLN